MKEAYLQYFWRHKKLPATNLKTTNKELLEILDFGFLNSNSGPDFFNGRVDINSQIWAGNIEIHVKSSDWYAHKHQEDEAYDNVVLHVVFEYDSPVFTSKGREIPTLEISKYIDEWHYINYDEFISNQSWVPCESQLTSIDDFYTKTFLERLTIERINRKSKEISPLLEREKNNWEEVFYQKLFSAFGSKVNQDVFLQIAQHTPLSIIQKIGNDVFKLEALFFGQAGLLEDEKGDDYFQSLKKEYKYLKQKHSLTSVSKQSVKFSKLRPPNFPTIRLAQFAQLMTNQNSWLMFSINSSLLELKSALDLEVVNYWKTHYVFDEESIERPKRIGESFKNSIIINVVVPFLLTYADHHNIELLKDKMINFLENISPESNSIIDKWKEIGVKVESAFQTQALLELKNEYCSAKKCLNCSIGVKLLNV